MEEEKRIYIGNLDYATTESDIKAALEAKSISVTEVKLIKDKYTGNSKGFGFAEFQSEEEALKAIEALNGQELSGRTLKVSKAQKMKPRRDNFGGGGSDGYNRGGRNSY